MPKSWVRNLILLMQPLALLVSTLAMRVPALAQDLPFPSVMFKGTDVEARSSWSETANFVGRLSSNGLAQATNWMLRWYAISFSWSK